MRKIQYPNNRKAFEDNYLKPFKKLIKDKQNDWEYLRNELISIGGNSSCYPKSLKMVLTLSYEKLVDLYLDYRRIGAIDSNAIDHDKEKEIFNYSSHEQCAYGPFQSQIAEFFMRHAQELQLSVCHYCEMSYINAYGLKTTFVSFEDFLRNGSKEELRYFVRKSNGGKYCDRYITKIYNLRYSSGNLETEFDKIFASRAKHEEVWGRMRNHFDLDHFLPKSVCPVVGLSLYNFVPSCAVCNEKLKGKLIWGDLSADELRKMSPSSDSYEFDAKVDIQLLPRNGGWMSRMQHHRDEVKLEFDSHGTAYSGEIEVLRLKERYNYHKDIAISLHDKLLDYPTSKIREIASLFHGLKTEEDVRNELFESEGDSMLMHKMKRDIRKKF